MSECREQGYKCEKLHHKVRMLHWQDVMDASKHHYVIDFHGDVPLMPLVGANT